MRPLFTICIPAYNRATHLVALLESIFSQDYDSYSVLICEDCSPQRKDISIVVERFIAQHPGKIQYQENETNLGYDGNIRRLVELANGEYCFFMGNDDILCEGALRNVGTIIAANPGVGIVIKSYAWFDGSPQNINQVVRYFKEQTKLPSGEDSIAFAFRRSGVISGYIVRRDDAFACATSLFDGSLYYQMHLTAQVLARTFAVATPKVLVLCRSDEPPDFGNSVSEKGRFIPGGYTPQARLHMVGGALSIIEHLRDSAHVDVVERVRHDYANFFYPYIRDQLSLPWRAYFKLYRGFCAMGFRRYPMFHLYFAICYILGQEKFDALTRIVRARLGRSPQFGFTTGGR